MNSDVMSAAILLCGKGSYAELAVNERGYEGKSPLHHASKKGQVEEVIKLLGQGANVFMEDENGGTPTSGALKKGHTEVVEILNEWKSRLSSAFRGAAESGELEAVRNFASNTAISYADRVKNLSASALNGHVKVTEFLLDEYGYRKEDLVDIIRVRKASMSEGAHLAVGMDLVEAALRRALG